MASTPGFELGPHWWEASALTTAPPLLRPQKVNEGEYTGTLMTEARIKEADEYKKGKYKNKKMEYIDILFFTQKALNFP